MNKNIHLLAALFISLVFTASCTNQKNAHPTVSEKKLVTKPSDDPKLPLKTRVVQNVSYNVVLKTYRNLAASILNLHKRIQILASDRSDANMLLAQQAWRDSRAPWESSEAFLFGPVESLGIDPMIDTWPLNRLDLDSILSSPRKITADFIGSLGTNVQGFHTLEYLLFGNGENSNEKSADSLTDKEIDYLLASSSVLVEHTNDLARSWEKNHNPDDPKSKGYVVMIMNPGSNNPFYSSEQSVLIEYLNGVIGIVDEVANGKIADPMGEKIGDADTTKVESPFSWNSLADFQNNIRSVQMIFSGDYDKHKGPGLYDLLKVKNSELAERVSAQIDKSIASIADISGADHMPFRKAILDKDGRVRIQNAIDELHILHAELENEVLPIINK